MQPWLDRTANVKVRSELRCTAARAVVILFWLATSAYAFLTSVPFVYEQFLEPGLVPALVRFAGWHGWLMMGGALLTALAAWPDIRDRRAPVAAGLLIWATAMAAVAAAVGEPMRALRPGTTALAASLIALAPVAWLAAIDLADRTVDGVAAHHRHDRA